MESLSESFQEWLVSYGPRLIGAVVVLVVGWWASRLIRSMVRRLMGRADLDETLTAFAGNLTYMALMALVVVTSLGQLGVATTSFAAIIGASALAIGFALQGSLANFAAGVMLMLFRPFKVGDFVEAGGVSGVVEEVQVFATKIRTGDNREITVPNGSITSGSIVNNSAKETRRIDLVFGIGYGDDIAKAKNVLSEIVDADERVLKDPAPTIAVSELADSSVNLVCRPWVRTGDYGAVRSDVIERVKLEFDRQHISIPFPQTDVHVHQAA
jgi:small conductance mechanosensitive channel